MSEKPKNGPAFPYQTESMVFPGMTLLDYFAGQALNGYIASKQGQDNSSDIVRATTY